MINNIVISEHMVSQLEDVMNAMEDDCDISQHFYGSEPYRKIIETVLQSYQQEHYVKHLRLTCGKCHISQLVDDGLMQCPSCGSTENIEMTAGNYVDSRPKITPVVPKEMTPEMMRAVQLHSELGQYAAENMSGAYDLFREFWDVACRAAMIKGG